MRISDWSSDVCSSDLGRDGRPRLQPCGDFIRGALAGSHRTIEVTVPDFGSLGAGPVQTPDRCAQGLAVIEPHAGREVAGVAAARPFFGGPDRKSTRPNSSP